MSASYSAFTTHAIPVCNTLLQSMIDKFLDDFNRGANGDTLVDVSICHALQDCLATMQAGTEDKTACTLTNAAYQFARVLNSSLETEETQAIAGILKQATALVPQGSKHSGSTQTISRQKRTAARAIA
ncbi:MAG TPA: hypothetical protein PLX97_02830 [Gemmatales bacterium]|nr:hypothetical protein [Gemmatales bacterium]